MYFKEINPEEVGFRDMASYIFEELNEHLRSRNIREMKRDYCKYETAVFFYILYIFITLWMEPKSKDGKVVL